ncbi:MAG: hypothetical protein WBA12_14055 [Catalinimonas sp.]
MSDVHGEPLADGDYVESLRYGLGKCRLLETEAGWVYESVENGQRVSRLRMVDAATGFQKVRRLPAG